MTSKYARYGYMDSIQNKAKVNYLNYSKSRETSGTLRITLLNLSCESINWLNHIKCTIVYNNVHTYDVIMGQKNPGQIAANGNTDIISTKAVETEPLNSAGVSFLFVIPKEVRDSEKPLIAYITIDDDIYILNMRDNMKIISKWGE